MARPLRIEYAGACYHVINRGNYRRSLFDGKGAAEAFERALGEAAARFRWRIHAYVVMRNHFHLALELGEPNLSEGMKWLQGTWIRRYNGLRKLVGRPFQGRYKALLVEPGHAFGQVCHYIHLNPVRAGVCLADALAKYPWSSLPKYLRRSRPPWLQPATVLVEAGGLPDTAAGWKRYVNYLQFLACDEGKQKELAAEKMSRGWCIGSHGFRRDMQKEMRQRCAEIERFAGLEEAIRAEREAHWEEQLQSLARVAGILLEKLPAQKSHPHKARLAAAMKMKTSVRNAWLAQRLAMGQPASASQFARRHLLHHRNRSAVAALLSRIKT